MTVESGQQKMQPFPLRSPGFIQPYAGTMPSSGYLLEYDGYWIALTLDTIRTIGNTNSGAAIAQSWAYLLYELIWNTYSNSQAPIFNAIGQPTTRSLSALIDWNGGYRLSLPDVRGRGIVGIGTGSNPTTLSARNLGSAFGAETHTLSVGEMPSHNHTLTIDNAVVWRNATSGSGGNNQDNSGGQSIGGVQWLISNTGGGGAHNNMQPSIGQHFLISAGAR